MIYTTFVFLFLCLAVGLVNARVHKVEVLADQKGSAIHRHMQNLILSSLEEMRGIIKERLDQFLTMLEALETTQLEHTVQFKSLDPENLASYVRDRDRILKDLTKAVNDKLANAIGTCRTVADAASQSVVNAAVKELKVDLMSLRALVRSNIKEKTDGTS